MSALSVLFLLASPALGQFIYVNSAKTWDAANEYCQATYGTSLATIKNNYDAAVLREKAFQASEHYWIGVNDLSSEGVWEWTSGYQCATGNCVAEDWWYAGYPRTSTGNTYDCGVVFAWATSAQNMVLDNPCSQAWEFMCDAPAVIDASTFGVAIGWEDYVLYAVAAINVVVLSCLAVFCLCTRQTPKYGKVVAYDSDSNL